MRIDSNEALLAFIDEVRGLHDALLHECVLLHPGYVVEDGSMFGDTLLPDARLLFQSQFGDVLAVQINLKHVSRCRFEFSRDFELEGEVSKQEVVLYLCGKRQAALSEIRASDMEVVMLGKECLGPEYRLALQPPRTQ